MKRALLAVGLVSVLIVAGAVAAEKAAGPTCGDRGLLLKISLPDGPQKAGGPIPMQFSITNTGSANVDLPLNLTRGVDEDREVKMSLIGSGAYIICQTERGEFLKFKGGWVEADGLPTTLKAGEELKAYTLDLAKCFDLPPDRYEVQILFTKQHSGFLDGATNRVSLTVK
jgi:hypothetical protein